MLPCRVPNLLINGSNGIAVGMATNIPPHNLCEVIDALSALIHQPDIELAELMEHVHGPDFPTGGVIMGRSGIRAAYATGRGKITLRGRAEIVEQKNGRFHIIITELPYMVNKARLLENIADLAKEKRIEGIADLNDESNREGMRVVVELKREANPQVVLNQLYRYTQLQDTVGVIMLALDKGVPKLMSLKDMLQKYLEFQEEVVRRRTEHDLKKAKERAHVLEGLRRAVDLVDEIIATIRACKGGKAEAKTAIMEKFEFDDVQATAIVNFQLGQLAGLEILKIDNELGELQTKIGEWTDLLSDTAKVLAVVEQELKRLYKGNNSGGINMQVKPLFDKVVIKAIETSETTESGIVLPGAAQEKPQLAQVVAVGPGGMVDGKEVVMQVKPGDKVLYSKYAGSEFKIDGEEVVIVRQADILAVVE